MSYINNYDWDELDKYIEEEELRKPYFLVMDDNNSEESEQEWLDNEFEYRLKTARSRLEEYQENYAYLVGIQYKSQYSPNRYVVESDYNAKNPKVVDNLVVETIQEKLAKMVRYDPNFSALPANTEWSDDIASKSAKMMVDTRWYDADIKDLFTLDQFYTFLYGTSFIKTYWDEDEGPINEETGERAGDVNYKVVPPDRIFPEKEDHWHQVDNLFEVEFRCPYELKEEYPNSEFDPENAAYEGEDNINLPDSRDYKNKVAVKYFYHRSTKFVDKGVKITFIQGEILKKEIFEHNSYDGRQKLPFNIHVDMSWPKQYWGVSYIKFIKNSQDQLNGLASAAARSFALSSLPKWMVPWGSCDIKTLANGHTIVKFKGPREPKLANMNPVGESLFTQQDRLRAGVERKSKVYNIYRRDQKIDLSGIALQYLDEQESEAVSPDISQRAKTILNVAQHTIDLMQFYYPKTGVSRFAKIFGEDDTYMAQGVSNDIWKSKYSIRLQNAPTLPQHKSSKMQLMLDIESRRPGMIKDETFLDLLGIADDKQYTDLITVSSRAARYENDIMIKMEGIPAPEPWENHIVHYELHLKKLQERRYKGKLQDGSRYAFEKHIKATEFLMWQKARENPAFRQKLMLLENYPIFFKIPQDDIQRANIMASGGDPNIVQQRRNAAQDTQIREASVIDSSDIPQDIGSPPEIPRINE